MTKKDIELPPLPVGTTSPMVHGAYYCASDMHDYARAAIKADRQRQFETSASLERYLECGGDEELDPIERLRFFCSISMSGQDWLDVERFFDDVIADRQQRGEPVAWPTHEFAIVVDRMYEGEGPSLAMWNGENYNFTDGDCYDREPDGSLDGYTAEWLTHHQLERRLFAAPQPATPAQEPSVPKGWKLVPVEPTSKQIVMMACQIKGADADGWYRTVGADWPDHVNAAERAYKCAIEDAPNYEDKS